MPNDDLVHFTSTDILRPSIPDLSPFPGYIQRACQTVVEQQRSIGESKTAVQTLFSIKEHLLGAYQNA